jgi:threonine dehydratase
MINVDDIRAAAARLAGVAYRTPLIQSPALDELTDGKVLLKAENLQRTGSFKIRGAYNMLSQLTAEESARGVVAFSSGNHAQAVAAAGTMLGIKTTIVMPEDAPAIKIENTRKLGGKTVLYDRYTRDRAVIAREIAEETGAVLVPSYDHRDIITGQGTAGLEIMEQCGELDLVPDQILVNCSGGGLTAGCAVAARGLCESTAIYPVEPELFDDTRRSLQSGKPELNAPDARTICDALMTSPPGEITFAINRELVSDVLVVSDDEVREAIRFAFRELKLVVEAGGAATLAAVLAGRLPLERRTTVVILSGGNIDSRLYAEIVASA